MHDDGNGAPREAGDTTAEPVEVPPDLLSPEALRGVAEAFVLREGTDYGEREVPFGEKVDAVLAQLREGRALLLYDPETETVTLRPRP